MDQQKIIDAINTLKSVPFQEIQTLGYHFQHNDYYSPLNDCAFLDQNRDLWEAPFDPLDVDWNLEGQLETARELSAYVEELRDIPDTSDDPHSFYWQNNFWSNSDALVQYGLMRSRKPRRVIEIGCGWSSLLLARAMELNGKPYDVTQIEPYPRRDVLSRLPAHWTLHESMLQRAPLELFDDLEAGDVLFYDGSHCSKVGSDVNWFFFRVLPRLKPGVIIHLHDISLPLDYPEDWIFERGQTWNEQYVLQAFLMNNAAYRILIANKYLWMHCPDELDQLYKGVQPSYGCSFWMEKQ